MKYKHSLYIQIYIDNSNFFHKKVVNLEYFTLNKSSISCYRVTQTNLNDLLADAVKLARL